MTLNSLIPVSTEANFDIADSSFFERYTHLPTPNEVRVQAKAQYEAGIQWGSKIGGFNDYNYRPSPAVFESMGCFIKWGKEIRIEEGQCLHAIRRCFKNSVPVPEVYGWRTDNNEVFIYMEAIVGQTLEQSWHKMGDDQRLKICYELRTIMDNLRGIKQTTEETHIGSITRSPLYDRAIATQYMSEAGPFTSVKCFHDWFAFLHKRRMSDPHTVPLEPFRKDLPDDCDILFTHGDLHPSNIMVSTSDSIHVIAIIDWEQSGWLPEYWEDRKARWSMDYLGEWAEKYLPLFLDRYDSTLEPWNYYTLSMGC